jgi:UDP-4-amino-4,6-dideoxy-N-acetyl-beta-L-altrosamine N-acetyltransferase
VIALRDLAPSDQATLLAWRNRPEVARWMYTDHAITPEEHARWWGGLAGDRRRRYWIVQLDGEDVGLANLADIDERNRRASFGLYLVGGGRGRGAGGAALYHLCRETFAVRGLHRLGCEALATNQAALEAYARAGFVEEGRLRQHVWKEGAPVDVVALAMLRPEWEARRAGWEARLRERGLLP